MTERLSDTYRFTGTLLVHDRGNTERPASAFVKFEDGRKAVTPAQDMSKNLDMRGALPQ